MKNLLLALAAAVVATSLICLCGGVHAAEIDVDLEASSTTIGVTAEDPPGAAPADEVCAVAALVPPEEVRSRAIACGLVADDGTGLRTTSFEYGVPVAIGEVVLVHYYSCNIWGCSAAAADQHRFDFRLPAPPVNIRQVPLELSEAEEEFLRDHLARMDAMRRAEKKSLEIRPE